jgi:cyclophilin family peptidyl-prolyl cis-trans isomerase
MLRPNNLGGFWLVWMLLAAAGCSSSTSVPASIDGGAAKASPDADLAGRKDESHSSPRVVVETNLGEFTLQLDRANAPLSVDNFLSYVKSGHYEGTIFHQATDGFIVLGGGYTTDLKEKPTHTPIRNEAHNGLSNRRGTVAMARHRSSIDSSTSQFFINLADNEALDHKDRTIAEEYGYCVFGKVAEGMEVVDKIGRAPVREAANFEMLPTPHVVIKSISMVR